MLHFLTKVWSLVASTVPATSHPFPGSDPSSPITSIKTKFDPNVGLFLASPTASSPDQLAWLHVISATPLIEGLTLELEWHTIKTSSWATVPDKASEYSGHEPPLVIFQSS